MPVIYHVTTSAAWEQALAAGEYRAASLETEGFIHCSEEHQLPGVLQRYFKGKTGLSALVINIEKLTAPLRYELSPAINEQFPHIYGALNLDAVEDVRDM